MLVEIKDSEESGLPQDDIIPLIDRLDIHFGRPPSHLPTRGKILTPDETNDLLNYIINHPKTKL